MRKQFNLVLTGEDLTKFNAIKEAISAPMFKARDPEVFRMCIRYYYEKEVKKKENEKEKE